MFDPLKSFYSKNLRQIEAGDTPTTYHRFELDQYRNPDLLDERVLIDRIFEDAQISHGPIKTNIDTFDNWIENILPVQISNKRVPYNGRVYYFTNIKYRKPRHPENPDIFLFPHIARREMLTYYSTITADSVFIPEDNLNADPVILKEEVVVAKIPVMLGSILCNLRGYTKNELRLVFEDASDPFGYFIVKGGERVVLLQENLVPMKRFSIQTKNKTLKDENEDAGNTHVDIKTIFTTQAVVGSTVVTIKSDKVQSNLNVLISQKGHKGASVSKIEYPIIVILDAILQLESKELYGYDLYDEDNIRNYKSPVTKYNNYKELAETKRKKIAQFAIDNIRRYVLPEAVDAVINFIQPSIQAYMRIESPRDTIVDIMKIYNHSTPMPVQGSKPAPPENKLVDGRMTDALDTEYHFEQISSLINDTFSAIELSGKSAALLRLTAQHIITTIGLRPIDDRDSWGNKRIKFTYENMAQVINGNFKVSINISKNPNEPILESSVKGLYDILVTSFGNAGFNNRKDAVESIRRNNQVLPISTIGRINPGAKRQTKQLAIRIVQPSQLGVVCPYETPTGAMCGLSKNMSVSTSVSLRRDSDKYRGQILESVLNSNGYDINNRDYSVESGRVHSIVLNGDVIAWCNMNVIEEPLRTATKRSEEFFDVGIFAEPEEMAIEIFTIGGRPLRPLLTTTSDPTVKGHLVINKPEVLNSIVDFSTVTVMELVKLGAIEFVHIEEQNRATVADTIQRVGEIYKNRIENNNIEMKKSENNNDVVKPENDLSDIDDDGFDEEDDFGNGIDEEVKKNVVEEKKNTVGTYNGRVFPVYCEINPVAVFGVAAGNMPYQNTCQGPRVTYQGNMANQAQGNHHDLTYSRFDSSAKRTDTGRAFLETQISAPIGVRRAPHGDMKMVAIIALANNGEDGIVAHQEALENYKNVKTISHRMILKNKDNTNTDSGKEEYRDFLAPPSEKTILERHAREGRNIFHAIGDDGLPRIGAELKRGDCVISRKKDIKSQIDGSIELTDMSLYTGIGEEGIVERVESNIIGGEDGIKKRVVRVKVRKNRPVFTGDKFASRYSQKGTIAGQRTSTGFVTLKSNISDPSSDNVGEFQELVENSYFARSVPVVSSGPFAGMTPDLIINPHGQPSRMTVGMMMEMLGSKASLFTGERIDGTAYRQPSIDKIEEWKNVLRDNGCDPDGFEEMIHPDNTKLKVRVFIGPCYYQCLHLVSDKIQYRSRGRVVHLTNQPVSGRSHGGGLRNGEMEKSAMCSWGATSLLLDRLKNSSDRFPLEICRTCGNQATVSYLHNNIRLCLICQKGAQDIGIVNTTYISILINRILLAMGIQSTYSSVRKLNADEPDE